MRWLASGVALLLILLAVPVARVLPPATLAPLLVWCGLLVVANFLFRRWAGRGDRLEKQIVTQALVDLVILTGLLNASGGIENPLYIAYVFHVIIPGILLPRRKAYALTAAACALFLFLVLSEYFGVLPHYTNTLFPHGTEGEARGASTPAGEERHQEPGDDLEHASRDWIFVIGRGLPFSIVLVLTSYFTVMVADRLRRSERKLEDAARVAMLGQKRLESVVDAARVGILLVAPDVTIRWFSQRAAQWLEWDDTIIGQRCPLDETSGGCETCIVSGTARTGRALESERAVMVEGGALRYFRHASSPVHDPDGKVVQVVELVEEITARKALEAEAMHAGKLSVLGRMAAGIAHEIGNPLSSLDARLHLLERRQDPAFVRESVTLLRSQISRIGRIVRSISQFSRGTPTAWAVWDLNAVLEEAVNIAKMDRRAREVTFRTNLASPPPKVRGIKDQISQVFLNLLLNALEAMPTGGTVTVATSRTDHEIRALVADTGSGMDEAVRQRLFEPFFTTKRDGTGLGLSVSYSLVQAHGGRIEVETEPGKGSRFVVVFPAGAAEEPALSSASGGGD
jgi:signal transduction histidine kinase